MYKQLQNIISTIWYITTNKTLINLLQIHMLIKHVMKTLVNKLVISKVLYLEHNQALNGLKIENVVMLSLKLNYI